MKPEIDTTDLTPEQVETVRAFAHAVKTGSPSHLEIHTPPYGDNEKWVDKVGPIFNIGIRYRIKPGPTAEEYLAAHKASGLKVGDRVKVLRIPEPYEGGWIHRFGKSECSLAGKIGKIECDDEGDGFSVSFNCRSNIYFPYFVLEKVEPKYRPWTELEAVNQTVIIPDGPLQDYEVTRILSVCNGVAKLSRDKKGGERMLLKHLLESGYTKPDGTPCGELLEGGEA